jgi:hypothetical protein
VSQDTRPTSAITTAAAARFRDASSLPAFGLPRGVAVSFDPGSFFRPDHLDKKHYHEKAQADADADGRSLKQTPCYGGSARYQSQRMSTGILCAI